MKGEGSQPNGSMDQDTQGNTAKVQVWVSGLHDAIAQSTNCSRFPGGGAGRHAQWWQESPTRVRLGVERVYPHGPPVHKTGESAIGRKRAATEVKD